jgi:CheY-like chemotaxis protein
MTGQLRVLVADDHDVHRLLLKTLFECFGCVVTAVEDGAQAMAAAGPFDLVCLDRHMPVCGGVAAAKAMRGQAFLLACTSDASPGLDDFQMILTKPISGTDICGAIEEAEQWRSGHAAKSPADTLARLSV